ncbi:signal recognition particle protein [Candidatus Odyssella acanthamoebae]|uniref:Signal recognition particle protein n=1 Tax=Candidatus Odyssella acanthamoebae TaxID=91604 RepID=A0A077ATJ9_9PROT|nr:signal recognition particle protein [Candidatus Paracaedibacter acanthamoebae]AIK95721.1 RNA-binding protein [Candidatus Paracaedibacter acanthamoebae]
MFQSLSKRLTGVLDKLRGRGALTEADVTAALREVRIALLEADVALPVVKQFIEGVREKAIGQDVIQSITPGQMVVKIVSDHLIDMLGAKAEEINLAVSPPAVVLMVGLQGSGKTTSTGKLAKYLKEKLNKKVLMASLDVYRPAAQLQLETLGKQLSVETLPIVAGDLPIKITERALKAAKEQGMDVLLLDTAGRLHIDQELMDEVVAVRNISNPIETFLVADAMTGQDAVTIAREFNEKVGVTGIILTRLDGDARGGAALSMRSVTGCPIKFMGMGEKLDQLEPFHPERIASRILDMGDIVSLVERASELVDQDEAERLAKKIQKGSFDLNDMEKQLESMLKMGGFGGIMTMLPGVGKIKDKMDEMGVDDSIIKRQIAIIRSMTKKERRDHKILNGSRRKRIAAGSGTQVQDVNRLVKQFEQMQGMMKRLGKMGKTGLMRGGLKGLFGR